MRYLLLAASHLLSLTRIGAATLTFEGLPEPPGGDSLPIPSNYGGLQWTNFSYLNAVTYTSVFGTSGYTFATVSSPHVAFNANGGPASFVSATSFNLDSAYLTGAWNDGLQVEVQGFAGSTLTYDRIYTVNSTAQSFIVFDYVGVNRVTFNSFGGVAHGYPRGRGTHFAIDNLTINAVPEPSDWALIVLGVVGLALRRERLAALFRCRERAPCRAARCLTGALRIIKLGPKPRHVSAIRLAAVLLLSLNQKSAAVTHYVAIDNPNPVPPYTNWATAATNIQDAVNAAVPTAGETSPRAGSSGLLARSVAWWERPLRKTAYCTSGTWAERFIVWTRRQASTSGST